MDVYLVRHAIAEVRDAALWPDDADRPLSPEGEEGFRSAARGLQRLVPRVEVVLSSPFVRAWRTAEVLREEAGWPSPERCDELAAFPPDSVVGVLRKHADQRSVALIGHEPHLSSLASLLVAGNDRALRLELKKGAAVRLALDAEPAPGAALLRWCVSPKILRLLDPIDARRRSRGGRAPARAPRAAPGRRPCRARWAVSRCRPPRAPMRGRRPASSTSSSSSIRSRRAGSRIGASTSTRRSRLRCIRSAEPNRYVASGPVPNRKIRECSRYRPTSERTRIVSDSPGTPGRRQQMLRGTRSIRAPASRGLVERVDQLRIGEAVQLHRDPAVRAGLAADQLERASSACRQARRAGCGSRAGGCGR